MKDIKNVLDLRNFVVSGSSTSGSLTHDFTGYSYSPILSSGFKYHPPIVESVLSANGLTYTRKGAAHNPINKVGVLELPNGKKIHTPILWYGLSVVEAVEFHMEVFKKAGVKAFLSNAFDLYIQDKKNKRKRIIEQLQHEGLLHKMDSGGFQLMKYSMSGKKLPLQLTPELVFKKQREIGCDIAVQLDVPLSPHLSRAEQRRTIERTIDNFIRLKELNEAEGSPLVVMPVAHGYDEESINYCIDRYEEILGKIPLIGIGSLVPMVKAMKGSDKIGGKWKFIELLIALRKRVKDSMIHAFGIGGTMSYLGFYCGIDSLDSNGWIQKSGYGVIQLPGISDRFLTKKSHNRPYLQNNRLYKRNGKKLLINEKDLFMNCECPVCAPFKITPDMNREERSRLWKEKVEFFDRGDSEGRLIRAIHNVWVFNRELELIRKHIENNTLDAFIEGRLITSTYYPLFLYARALKEDNLRLAEQIKSGKLNKDLKNGRQLEKYF